MSDRKRRSDAFEAQLPGNAVMELRDGLLGKWSYSDAREWLLGEHGQDVSETALRSFHSFYCAPVLQEQIKMAAAKAEVVAQQLAEESVDWDSALIGKAKQLVFELMLDPNADSKDIARMMKLVLADKALGHDARKLAILEEKAKRDDATREVMEDTTKTDEEKAMEVREIFGLI